MKTFKSIFLPACFLILSVSLSTLFYGCNPDDCDDEEETCDTCMIAYKPNIYLYPESETVFDVQLHFPKGGGVITSIPTYGTGWTVSVDTAGIIDGKYDFLFYESEQPNVWQTEKGWCVKTEDLTTFFTLNLNEYGFKGREIDDFIDYWIPRFVTAEYYIIYPQTKEVIDDVIELSISDTPDNILRLFYLIEESNTSITIDTPIINAFNRYGFYVSEWGVILK